MRHKRPAPRGGNNDCIIQLPCSYAEKAPLTTPFSAAVYLPYFASWTVEANDIPSTHAKSPPISSSTSFCSITSKLSTLLPPLDGVLPNETVIPYMLSPFWHKAIHHRDSECTLMSHRQSHIHSSALLPQYAHLQLIQKLLL